MRNHLRAVLVEDTVANIRTAWRILNQAGIECVLAFDNLPGALTYLEDVAAGEQPCPDLIVLGLGVGTNRGFEALRLRKSRIKLSHCKVVVWTTNGELREEICKLLGASHVVAKEDGETALLNAVTELAARSAHAAAEAG